MFKRKGVYKIRKIFPEVYQIRNAGVNMYLFIGTDKALLFDSGYGFEKITPLIKELTDKPLEIVCSHGHLDHIGCNDEFEYVYMHKDDFEVALKHSTRPFRELALENAKRSMKNPFNKVLPNVFDLNEYINKPYGFFKEIKENDEFDLGKLTLKCIELPGHTKGSIGLYWLENKCLFVSDAINGYLYLFLEESTSLKEYISTLYKAEKIDFDYMIQAHSNQIYNKKIIYDYIDVAEKPNWEKGRIRENTLTSGYDSLVKIVMSKKHPKLTAKLVIDENRLDGR